MKKIKEFIEKHKALTICAIVLVLMVVSVLVFGWVGLWYDAIVAMIVGIILTGMKKHGLLKVLCIIMLLIMLVSYLLPSRQSVVSYIGLADLLNNYVSIVLQNFAPVALFILAIGGLYGVLNKTPSYKKLLDNTVAKAKPLGKKYIYVLIIIFAIVSSLTGVTLPLFIFVPFFVAVILLLGYDKLVAFSTTIVSIIIGYIGGIFTHFIDPNTGGITTFEKFVGMEDITSNIFPKLLLLFAGIALLIYFVGRHIKNVEEKKVKYELSDDSELLVAEVKGKYKDLKTWPLIVILALTFVILVIGVLPWYSLLNVTVFSDFHSWLLGLHIKDFYIFSNLISSNLPALGEWNGAGSPMGIYIYETLLLIFVAFVISLINKNSANDNLDNYIEGAKKALPAAGLVTLAYGVLVCAFNNGFLEGIISNYGKFNYGVSALLGFLACLLNVDTVWIVLGGFSPMIGLITDESIYASVAILFQGVQGIFMVFGPTSLILILGLSYFDIPYTTWLKYIWRFVLYLIVLVALVTLIVALL